MVRVQVGGGQLSGGGDERGVRAYLDAGKQLVEAEWSELPGVLERLGAGVDVLVCDLHPEEMEELGLDRWGAIGVRVLVTPFGRVGPRRTGRASSASLLALGGHTYLSGDPGRAPLTMPGRYPYYQAGTYAYVAALGQLLAETDDVTVDVSVLETLTSLHQFTDTFWTFERIVRSRHGNRWENLCPTTLLPARDGWVAVNILQNFWEPFALWVGGPELAGDEQLALNEQRMQRQDDVEAFAVAAFEDRPMLELFREGQETWRVPIGYTASLESLRSDPHLRAREFFQPIEVGALKVEGVSVEAQVVEVLASPFRFVGEALPEAGGVTEERRLARVVSRARRAGEERKVTRPLEGVRVLDMTRIWSGPLATRILGDLGAEVVKVEAPAGRGARGAVSGAGGVGADRPWNRQPLFNKLSRNKQSVALDLKQPAARDVFLRLMESCDVLVENFSARAMPRLGLGFDSLRERNPGLIYMQMPALGLFGPYRDYIGLGPSIEPLSGLTAVMGYGPDEPRVTAAAVTDAASGVTAAAAIMTALSRRLRTGDGMHIDLSQGEAMTALLGEYVIESQLPGGQLPGGMATRMGNAHFSIAPHGVYRCAGEDAWICITAMDEGQWSALCVAAGTAGEAWAADARFASMAARATHREALDAAIGGWTAGQKQQELSELLLRNGVAAGAVQSAPQFLSDPHLEAVGYYSQLTTADTGSWRYDGSPIRANGERGYEAWFGAPGLGEHNREVLLGLGYREDEIHALTEAGVLVDRPPS